MISRRSDREKEGPSELPSLAAASWSCQGFALMLPSLSLLMLGVSHNSYVGPQPSLAKISRRSENPIE